MKPRQIFLWSRPVSLLRDCAYKGEGPFPPPVHSWCLEPACQHLVTRLLLIQECLRKTGSSSQQVAESQGSWHFKRSQPSGKAALQVALPQWWQGLYQPASGWGRLQRSFTLLWAVSLVGGPELCKKLSISLAGSCPVAFLVIPAVLLLLWMCSLAGGNVAWNMEQTCFEFLHFLNDEP